MHAFVSQFTRRWRLISYVTQISTYLKSNRENSKTLNLLKSSCRRKFKHISKTNYILARMVTTLAYSSILVIHKLALVVCC